MHALEFPVCTFDLKTGVLCAKCEGRLNSGEVTKLDLDVMQFLIELEKKIPQLSSLSYIRSIKINDYLFLLFKERNLTALSPQTQNQIKKLLTEKFGLNIKLVEDHRDLNSFIQSLIIPARILGINKVWLPDQTIEVKVVVEDDKMLKTPVNVLSEVLKQFKDVSVSFEPQKKERPAAVRFRR